MSNIQSYLKNKDYYKKLFESWVANEIIIDDNKAIWELKDPSSNCTKVCLYRDGYTLFVYGDYGQYSFDNMTWIADIHTLAYDDLGYQFQKLSKSSKEALFVFDSTTAVNDIANWVKNILTDLYNVSDYQKKIIVKFLKEYDESCTPLDDFINEHPSLDEIQDVLKFACKLITISYNDERPELISFLRNHSDTLDELEKDCAAYSSLWDAGMITHQTYYVTMYALEICSKKLKKKGIKDNGH